MLNISFYIFIFVISFLIIAGLGQTLLNALTKLRFRQQIREDGPSWHNENKKNTPTAGGIIFSIILILGPLFSWIYSYISPEVEWKHIGLFLIVISFAGLIGFLDDYLKKVKMENEGLKPKQKFTLQLALSVFLALSLNYLETNIFGLNINLSWPIYSIFSFCVLAGTMNAINLTDGLDGLATSICGWAYLSLGVFIMLFSPLENVTGLVICSIIMSAICFGFLCHNGYPAKVFMGDTGSLALGGGIAAIACIAKIEWYLIILLFVPVLETLSVILQVICAKFSRKFLHKDIRPFKMTPYHHHLELSGWSEQKIVFILSMIQITVIAVFITLSQLI